MSLSSLSKRRFLWPCAVVIAMFLLGAVHGWVLRRELSTYRSVVDDPELIAALSGNETAVSQLISSKGLAYQEYGGGSLLFSSDPTLPTPKIIPISFQNSSATLSGTPSASLRQTLPYLLVAHAALTVAVPFFTGSDGTGYILYAPVEI